MVRTPEVDRIVRVRQALADLPEPILFVGASVLGLLASDPNSPEPRATEDVDIVALVVNFSQRIALDERLRRRGFSEDAESGVICRWRYQDFIVDVMPPTPEIFGFSNELYPSALASPMLTHVDDVAIPHIDAPHFLGTKLLAFEGRGKEDLIASHDLEDLLAVLNSRPEIVAETGASPSVCREVVLSRLRALRENPRFRNAADGHLANDAPGRVDVVLARIDAILAGG